MIAPGSQDHQPHTAHADTWTDAFTRDGVASQRTANEKVIVLAAAGPASTALASATDALRLALGRVDGVTVKDPGNSGGPAFDRSGRVVVIVNRGKTNSNSINFGILVADAFERLAKLVAPCGCLRITAPPRTPVFVDGEMIGQGPRLVRPLDPTRKHEIRAIIGFGRVRSDDGRRSRRGVSGRLGAPLLRVRWEDHSRCVTPVCVTSRLALCKSVADPRDP